MVKKLTLFEEFPELVKEWDYDKNNPEGVFPSDITRGSHKVVWWRCRKGHSWMAHIYHRTAGKGCPYCSGKKVLIGYNDLASKAPWLSGEWDYEKNNGISPETVTYGSNRKVWWKCRNGHSWLADISHRYGGNGCPYCSGRKVWAGYNDFASVYPSCAKEWDSVKNEGMLPSMVAHKSNRKVWWKCRRGHSWQALVSDRASGKGCPYCSGRYAIPGYNDLGTVNKPLAAEWDYDKNGEALPKDFTQGSNKKVWWRCNAGHSWKAAIYSRNGGHRNCPYCSGKRVLAVYNDLATTNPTLAIEWEYERNDGKLPEHFTGCSKKKVWWRCDKGHSWLSTIHNRTLGNGCPYCSGRNAISGYNDLLTVRPDLIGEWDYDRNQKLQPGCLTANAHNKVWWKCNKGHSWRAAVYSRTNGRGCPYCAGKVAVKTNFIS